MAKKKELIAEIEKLESEIKWLKEAKADMRFALRSIVFDMGNKSYVIARWKGIFHIEEQLEKVRWRGLQHLGDGYVKQSNII